MKKKTASLLIFMFCSTILFSQTQELNRCNLTRSIPIATGFDHSTSTLLPGSTVDPYWSIEDGPGSSGPYPRCAWSHGWSSNCFPGPLTTSGVNMIGFFTPAQPPTMTNNCSSNGNNIYEFERKFRVELGGTTTSMGMYLKVRADDIAVNVSIIDPSNTVIFNRNHGSGCDEQVDCYVPVLSPAAGINLTLSGVYRLRIQIHNHGDGIFNNLPTPVNFELSGSLFNTFIGPNDEIFLKNEHFGKNTGTPNCATAYGDCSSPYQADLTGNKCITTGSGTFGIAPYCPTTVYVFDDGSSVITSTGASITLTPGTYTMTATDANNCTYSRTIIIGSPSISATPVNACVPSPGGTTAVNLTITNSSPITDIAINGVWQPYTPSFTPVVGIGSHTIDILDENDCTASTTFVVGNDFTANLVATPFCFVTSGILTATTNPATLIGPVDYEFFDPSSMGPPTPTNTQSITLGGPYSVIVTDAYGCSASATTVASAKPIINPNVGPCVPTTASPTVSTGGFHQFSLNGGPYLTSPSFPITTPGVYTIVASDGYGCTNSQTFTVLSPRGCCFTSATIANAAYVIPHGSSVLSYFGTSPVSISTTQDVLIEGDFIVDATFNITNCPNVILGPNARIIVNAGEDLVINNSELRAGCNEMWTGIIASDINSMLDFQNSNFIDMDDGVRAQNGTKLKLIDNVFTRNYIGLQIENTDIGFTYASGRCDIQGNTFTSDLAPLLVPHNSEVRGEHGIKLINCLKVYVGHSDGLANPANNFSNLFNGIYVQPTPGGVPNDMYFISDFAMNNIRAGYNETAILRRAYGDHRGTGIFCPSGAHNS